jgi:hypothetical protein
LPWKVLPLIIIFPLFLAWWHSQASNVLGYRNRMYLATPAAENMPQYCDVIVSMTMHLKIDIILSCLICTISPYTVVST